MEHEMVFRTLTVLSDKDIAITFECTDGTMVTHRFTVEDAEVSGQTLTLANCDRAFFRAFRWGLDTPRWPEQLAVAARNAFRQPFPAGQTLDRLLEEARERRLKWWKSIRPEEG